MPFNSNGKQQLFNSAAAQRERETAELENVTSSKMANASVPFSARREQQTGAAAGRAEPSAEEVAEVNPAANVKTVARLKSMGDGGSSQIGSAMAAVTQRETGGWGGLGSLLYAKASGASRRPYR